MICFAIGAATSPPVACWRSTTTAPADNARVAVAVALENQTGTGGATAAPIAKQLMEDLLSRKSNS